MVGSQGIISFMTSNAVPAILGVTAAVALLKTAFDKLDEIEYKKSLDYQLSVVQDIRTEEEKIRAEIDNYKQGIDNATEEEKAKLKILEQELKVQEQLRKAAEEEAFAKFSSSFSTPTLDTEEIDWLNIGSETSTETAYIQQTYSEALDALNAEFVQGSMTIAEYNNRLWGMQQELKPTYDQLMAFKDMGMQLNQSMLDSIEEYQRIIGSVKEFPSVMDDATNSIIPLTDEAQQAAKSMKGLAEGIIAVATAAGKGGEHDSAFKTYAASFATLKTEFEAGRIGSVALATALQQLTDAETYAAFESGTFAEKTQILKDIMPQLATMFGDAESGGLGYLDVMKKLANANGEIVTSNGEVAATVKNVNGQLQYNITDVSKLASAMNISTGSLLAMAQAGKIFGYDFKLNAEDVASAISEMGVAVEETADGLYKVDAGQLTDALSELGIEGEQLTSVKDTLVDIGGIELTDLVEQENGVTESANDANTAIENINEQTFDSVQANLGALISQLQAVAREANNAANAVAGINGKTTGVQKKATGTRNFSGGLALVNDGAKVNGSAKELIVDNGRAFMMPTEPALVNLDKGAVIYNAKETQGILGGIPSYAKGGKVGHVPVAYGGINGSIGATVTVPDTPVIRDTGHSGGGGGRRGMTDEEAKKAFEKWLKEEKHLLAMDEITEEQYYDDLEEMMEKYLANRQSLIEEYWKYEEEVYKYRKKALEDVIDLEERLNDLARAKTQKVLVYKDGMFQYVNNVEAIANAQNALAKALSKNAGASADLGGGFGTDMTAKIATIGTSGDTFNIGEVTLSDVTNVNDIFDGLKNLAIQQSAK